VTPPLAAGSQHRAVPRFYVTPRARFSPGAVILAVVIALACLAAVLYALGRARQAQAAADDDDDPSRVDTIYLGDPSQAPQIARPKPGAGDKPGTVHPFVVVHLPRAGDGTGQIPDTPAGRLLFAWLAAFNGTDPAALAKALPTAGETATEAAQWQLRQQTGGFTLLSAKEVQPGVLVFRLHDQTPAAGEALGTLQVNPASNPPSIATFSLSAVPSSQPKLK